MADLYFTTLFKQIGQKMKSKLLGQKVGYRNTPTHFSIIHVGGNETDESTKMFFIADNELKTELYKDYIWEKISDNGKMSLETFLKFRSCANQ